MTGDIPHLRSPYLDCSTYIGPFDPLRGLGFLFDFSTEPFLFEFLVLPNILAGVILVAQKMAAICGGGFLSVQLGLKRER